MELMRICLWTTFKVSTSISGTKDLLQGSPNYVLYPPYSQREASSLLVFSAWNGEHEYRQTIQTDEEEH